MYGENTRELGWFVKAGMTPEQALKAATVNGAALLGQERSLGPLRPGYFADVVAVEGDPLADIQVAIDGAMGDEGRGGGGCEVAIGYRLSAMSV